MENIITHVSLPLPFLQFVLIYQHDQSFVNKNTFNSEYMQMFCACDHPGKGTATYTPSRSKSNAKIGNSVTEIRNF